MVKKEEEVTDPIDGLRYKISDALQNCILRIEFDVSEAIQKAAIDFITEVKRLIKEEEEQK